MIDNAKSKNYDIIGAGLRKGPTASVLTDADSFQAFLDIGVIDLRIEHLWYMLHTPKKKR